jgi:hypothetical protein
MLKRSARAAIYLIGKKMGLDQRGAPGHSGTSYDDIESEAAIGRRYDNQTTDTNNE